MRKEPIAKKHKQDVIIKTMTLRQILACVLLAFTSACAQFAATVPTAAPEISRPPAVTYELATQLPTAKPEAPAAPQPSSLPAIPSQNIADGARQLRNGDWLQAIAILGSPALLNAFSPDQAWAQSLHARALSNLGQHQAALDLLLQVSSEVPPAAQTASRDLQIGNAYAALGDSLNAAAYYLKYLDSEPAVLASYVWQLIADLRAAADDQAGAADAYGSAILADRAGPVDHLLIARAGALFASGRPDDAAAIYDLADKAAASDFTRAKIDLLRGQLFAASGSTAKAQSFYQHAIENYPETASAYLALVALLDGGATVNDLQRGRVDYHNGKYQPAVDALENYIRATPQPVAEATYLLARSYAQLDQPDAAEPLLRGLIALNSPTAERTKAWLELARVQLHDRDDPKAAVQTYLDFVETGPAPTDGAAALASAARASASAGTLRQAADIWLRSAAQYPDLPTASPASFQAGIMLYRLDETESAQTAFAAAAAATTATPEQIAAAKLWQGKTSAKLGQTESALSNYSAAAAADPRNYYGLRASQLQAGSAPLLKTGTPDLRTDFDAAQNDFEQWLSAKLSLSTTTGLRELAEPLRADGRWQRGSALWQLGLEDEARTELVSLRLAVRTNALATYQLALAYRELGYFYGSIYAARDCVDALGFEQTPLEAPRFLTLLRFGPYYEDLIASAAAKEKLDPLLMAALIRQESLFSSTATSSAAAQGLMQIIPPTGDYIATKLAWPGYVESDLNRPIINVPFGAFYLAEQRRNFEGNPYAMLAAYNAGPGNARRWLDLAGDDPDLFLEVTTATETQRYIRRITEYRAVYAALYEP